jgi:hypothetical protein
LPAEFGLPRSPATSSNKQRRLIGLLAVAVLLAVAFVACGTSTSKGPLSRSATMATASCKSAYVDWLSLSGAVTCDQAKAVAGAIFIGDDGNERTSFMREDFSPLLTVRVRGWAICPRASWACGTAGTARGAPATTVRLAGRRSGRMAPSSSSSPRAVSMPAS